MTDPHGFGEARRRYAAETLAALLDLLRDRWESGLLLDVYGIDDDDPLADALEAWADAGYPGVSDE